MTEKFLKLFRICYTKLSGYSLPPLICEKDAEKASVMIYNLLNTDRPCMISRFGATEITTMVNYLGVKQGKPKNIFKYIKGDYLDWWWYPEIMNQMQRWSGFFPPTPLNLSKFCEMIIEDIKYVDILGSWLPEEYYFEKYLCNKQKVKLVLLEPYYSLNPWSRILKDKNVLVVHPFAKTIEEQYQQRKHLLFNNKDILPEFNLFTIPAVQSLNGDSNGFSDWFEALYWMKTEIDRRNYDICLIGCGAYGLPLAAHVKRQGKKSVHLGGALQLLFGIWGNRWEDKLWNGFYTSLKNEYWVRPTKEKIPKVIEPSSYW
jgi:hypothetical protein